MPRLVTARPHPLTALAVALLTLGVLAALLPSANAASRTRTTTASTASVTVSVPTVTASGSNRPVPLSVMGENTGADFAGDMSLTFSQARTHELAAIVWRLSRSYTPECTRRSPATPLRSRSIGPEVSRRTAAGLGPPSSSSS